MNGPMEVYEEEDEYMSGYLNKKEDGNKWVLYWVVLTDRLLKHFKVCHNYDYDDTEECSLVGWTEVTPQTKCILGKKKDNGYLFYIEKRGKRYLYKTPCLQTRHQWMKAVEAAVHGNSLINLQVLGNNKVNGKTEMKVKSKGLGKEWPFLLPGRHQVLTPNRLFAKFKNKAGNSLQKDVINNNQLGCNNGARLFEAAETLSEYTNETDTTSLNDDLAHVDSLDCDLSAMTQSLCNHGHLHSGNTNTNNSTNTVKRYFTGIVPHRTGKYQVNKCESNSKWQTNIP